MIARFGSTELETLVNYLGVKQQDKNIWNYIKGHRLPWWWNHNILNQMQMWSGFFPPTIEKIERFCELMIEDVPLVDVLGSWLPHEQLFRNEMQNSYKVELETLNPHFAKAPWTRALKGKKVLVVHPFVETIEKQYRNKELVFPNELLPDFELKSVKAVQTIAGVKTSFNNWFEALNHMKGEIDRHDYDVCLIGCGAYGFPLAAHVKRQGKKGFHLGGSLQLLFGIRGKRWESPTYNPKYNYYNLMNEHWVRPANSERPDNAEHVEGAVYW